MCEFITHFGEWVSVYNSQWLLFFSFFFIYLYSLLFMLFFPAHKLIIYHMPATARLKILFILLLLLTFMYCCVWWGFRALLLSSCHFRVLFTFHPMSLWVALYLCFVLFLFFYISFVCTPNMLYHTYVYTYANVPVLDTVYFFLFVPVS